MLWSRHHYQSWIQSPTVFLVESPGRQQFSRQEPAFLCGRAQLPGLKQWHWADTAFRNQKSWIPNYFSRKTKTSPSLPVQCSHHESSSPSLLSPTPFFLHTNTASTGVEQKTCSEFYCQHLWRTVTPVVAAVYASIYPSEGIWHRNPSYTMSAALQQLPGCIPEIHPVENEIIQGSWVSQWERRELTHIHRR